MSNRCICWPLRKGRGAQRSFGKKGTSVLTSVRKASTGIHCEPNANANKNTRTARIALKSNQSVVAILPPLVSFPPSTLSILFNDVDRRCQQNRRRTSSCPDGLRRRPDRLSRDHPRSTTRGDGRPSSTYCRPARRSDGWHGRHGCSR